MVEMIKMIKMKNKIHKIHRNAPIEEGEKYSSWAQHIEFPIVWEAL